MKGRRLGRWAYGLAALLALALAGDGGRAATVPAAIYGQDPLEVLSLKVRPNVIVVLDSSGSMTNNAPESTNTRSGDHPRSKMYQAKAVLRQIVQANQDKVSFQLGTYTQNSISFNNQGANTTGNRFQYVTDDAAASGLRALGAVGDGFGRGLQSWQIIQTEWNRLYFGEANGTIRCYATVPGTPRFYNQGSLLAADLQAAMNTATCTAGSRQNTYSVTYDTTTGVFTFGIASGPNNFQIRWADAGSNIAGAMGRRGSGNTSSTTFTRTSGSPYRLLHRNSFGGSGGGLGTQYSFTESGTTYYQLSAGRLWNGEVVRVQADGTVCGMTFPTAAERTNPPTLTLQLVANGCGADTAGSTATFTFAGGGFGRSGNGCSGFRSKSDLVPCDLQSPPAPTQFVQISPYIDLELPFQTDGRPADLTTNGAAYGSATYGVPDGIPDYVEAQDGSFATESIDVAPSAKAAGFTPIANSLIDIKGAPDGSNTCVTNAPPPSGTLDSLEVAATVGACTERGFQKLWNVGQAGTTNMAGPPPWQLDPISTHVDPKEKTIVLFVTDGDDTCGSRGDASNSSNMDGNARRAASYAEALYTPIAATEPASSVLTYVIGFGGAFTAGEPYRLNWIAWGGSGLGQGTATQPDVNWFSDSSTTLSARRAQCSTCEDAFIAPDAATLARQLQGLIDQGASSGDFTAQQSITESLFEYVDRASDATTTYDARSPSTRYRAITPTRIISSFSLPGFNGQVKAYQNDGFDNAVLRWSAGDKLNALVRSGFTAANCPAANGGNDEECMFRQLHGGVGTDPASSSAAIKRRIYTTERNGLFTFDAASLMAGTANQRISLWPPSNSAIVPADYTTQGSLDVALGLPADSAADPATEFTNLQTLFKACLGSNLPAGCTSSTASTRMRAARREAREVILAFAAGAKPIPETTGLKRSETTGGAADRNQILYTYRSWVLADSELATAAVVTPPLPADPTATPYLEEYRLFRDGSRDGSQNPDSGGSQIAMGFGLRNPDNDGTVATGNDSRTALKPVMTVVYVPANDMLHAFRAGPNVSPSTLCDAYATTLHPTTTIDCGGEELWGFVPYDQLGALNLLTANQPQGRDNHVYMLARGIRFSDVFVPQALTNVNIGGVTQPTMQGVWRRILYVGRGIGGKSLTALDVTAPGAYTDSRLQTQGPIPLWSRGNPDTATGLGTGTANGSAADTAAYATMGQTWSIPVVAYVGGQTFYANKRANGRAGCSTSSGCPVDHVLFAGSGYSEVAGQGTTFYTLDALTGDVIAAADVEPVASVNGLGRSPKPTDREGIQYENALVANPAGFNPEVFKNPLKTVHPAAAQVSRVYFGDLYGRLWKVLTAQPDVVIPVADLGADQPIGAAASLLGLPQDTPVPYVFVASGADRRQSGPFRMFGFWDQGDDVTTTTSGTSTTCVDAAAPCETGVTSFLPVEMVFNRFYDQGTPDASCGYTAEEVFRGTAQPAAAFECGTFNPDPRAGDTCTNILGRVFFVGTRLSLPNTRFAPPTPLACGQGDYPCRSQFDSILYALGAETGNAAYDLNASGDDAYRIFRDSRLVAVQMQADPDPGRQGSSLTADEGLVKAAPKPPPPPGVPPTANTSTANVVMTREPGQPPPAVRYGSTVCQ